MNGFRFSTAKTKAMHFCRSRGNCVGVPLRLYGAAIPLECSVRFLGLTMDSRLTYKEHFKLLKEKCGKVLNVLKCVSNHLRTTTDTTTRHCFIELARPMSIICCIRSTRRRLAASVGRSGNCRPPPSLGSLAHAQCAGDRGWGAGRHVFTSCLIIVMFNIVLRLEHHPLLISSHLNS